MNNLFKSGDILSYPASACDRNPYAFQVVQKSNLFMESIVRNFPRIAEIITATPLIINCYPAALFFPSCGVFVESFMKQKNVSRALNLAAKENMPAVILGQALFVADALKDHVRSGGAIPKKTVVATGGYYSPRSLEDSIRMSWSPHADLEFLSFYGIDEIDPVLLISAFRTPTDDPIYLPRNDKVKPTIKEGKLFISLWTEDCQALVENFRTGDCASYKDEGIVIRNPRRLGEMMQKELESWSHEFWDRRTGYVGRDSDKIIYQMRKGIQPRQAEEMDYFAFQARFASDFLSTPAWRDL